MSDIEENRGSAVSLTDVCKRYLLFHSLGEELLDALGLLGRLFWRRPIPEHLALQNVSLSIGHGERVGIIGRNGAGKSTLLKLISRTITATSGQLEVDGSVQSLSDLGVGFHPDFTGRENVRAALAYNDLSDDAMAAAIEDIVDFCDLERFIDMPLRSYSAGMMARLYFATATAIRPDILVVDEVMGAGDAYFAARSSARMRQLALSGATLLLVSHSMQQVVEFCDRCIWIERGRVIADGPSLTVVKAYEAFIQHLSNARTGSDDVIHNERIVDDAVNSGLQVVYPGSLDGGSGIAEGGISAWPASGRIRTAEVWFEDSSGNRIQSCSQGAECVIALKLRCMRPGNHRFRACAVLFGPDGRWASRMISSPQEFAGDTGDERVLRCSLSPLRLGPAKYVMTVSLHEANEPWNINSAERLDLLSRSFTFSVLPDERSEFELPLPVRHPSKWARV